MNYKYINLHLFDAPANETMKADLEPAISIDLASRLSQNITELQNLLGIVDPDPMAAGTLIKIYRMTQANTPAQVGEGEDIALTKVKRELANTIELTLNKYRRQTTAEAIQKVGRNIAINDADTKLISGVRKDIKKNFYTALATGTGTVAGTSLQTGLAKGWSAVKKYFSDYDANAVYFISVDDVADYLSTAQITLQTAFGFDYVENFLGLGDAIITADLEAGTAYATAKENLRAAYVPTNSGDLAQSFGLTSDETGLVGITHQIAADNASITTLIMSGVVFYPEYADGVFKITTKGA